MSTRFSVNVDADQFDRLARPTQPLAGVAELIWNSLDAEADVVTVSIDRNDLGGVESVVVTDDGHGMTNQECIRDFRRLGGSWKRVGTGGRRLSKHGERSLHGRDGEGRFRAFALGRNAEWSTVADGPDGTLARTIVHASIDDSGFEVSDPVALASGTRGTTVRTNTRATTSPACLPTRPRPGSSLASPYT